LGPYGVFGLPKPENLIPEKVRETDPEAAAVADYMLSFDMEVEQIAKLCLDYPQNDFLTYSLISAIVSEDALNPQIADLLVDTLIQKDPENAHFHYLKAYVRMHTTPTNRFHEILQILEEAGSLDKFALPYDPYHQRIMVLLEKAKRSPDLNRAFSWTLEYMAYKQLLGKIWDHAGRAIRTKERDYGLALVQAGSAMGKKCVDNASNSLEFLISSSILGSMCATQLHHTNLEVSQYRDARACLRSIRLSLAQMIDDSRRLSAHTEKMAIAVLLAVLVAVLFVWFLPAYLLALISATIRKMPKHVKLGWTAAVLFPVALLCFFCLLVLVRYLTKGLSPLTTTVSDRDQNHSVLLLALIPLVAWLLIWLLSLVNPSRKISYRFWKAKLLFCAAFCIALIMSWIIVDPYSPSWKPVFTGVLIAIGISIVLWLLLMYAWWLIKLMPYRWLMCNRIVQLSLVTTSLAGLFSLCASSWWSSGVSIVFIAFTAIILVHPPSNRVPALVLGLKRLFGSSEETAIARRKILQLLAPYLAAFYVCVLVAVAFAAPMLRKTIAMSRRIEGLQDYRPLLSSDPQEYQEMLDNALEDETAGSVTGLLNAVEPHDLPRLLSRINKKPESTINDSDLRTAIEDCAPDALYAFVAFLERPDANDILIARAKAGDKTVEPKLWRRLWKVAKQVNIEASKPEDERRRNAWRWPHPARLSTCFELAAGIAYITTPQEATDIFLKLIENTDLELLQDDSVLGGTHDFFESLKSLPTSNATIVLKAYLNKTDYTDLQPGKRYFTLEQAISYFADADIAERIFVIMSRTKLTEKPLLDMFGSARKTKPVAQHPLAEAIDSQLLWPHDAAPDFRRAIAPYFNSNSIPVLEEGLTHSDDNIRAYSIWQLTQVGYNWPCTEIQNFLKDKNWKVRANALLASPKDALKLSQTDTHSLVKLLADLLPRTSKN